MLSRVKESNTLLEVEIRDIVYFGFPFLLQEKGEILVLTTWIEILKKTELVKNKMLLGVLHLHKIKARDKKNIHVTWTTHTQSYRALMKELYLQEIE